jgi:hypothetical protein
LSNLKYVYEYMVEINLPVPFDEEFLSLIPRQRAIINKQLNEGIITSYAVSIESGKLWASILAESESEVFEIISYWPIIDKITYEINKLAFHNSASLAIPKFSEN